MIQPAFDSDMVIQPSIDWLALGARWHVDGKTPGIKSDAPAFVHEDTATYYFAVPPVYLANARFELAERSFAGSARAPRGAAGRDRLPDQTGGVWEIMLNYE